MRRVAGPLLLLGASAALALVLLELGTRAIFARHLGAGIFLYGTSASPYGASEVGLDEGPRFRWDLLVAYDEWGLKEFVQTPLGGHSKYPPGSTRPMKIVGGERYVVTFNNHGFRGPDFARAARAGVVRVAALGGSSTFGYFARDEETWPRALERHLEARRDRCPGVEAFEVLNFGIPHLDSAAIRSLFETEVLGFAPDVVTLYTGANETRQITRPAGQARLIAWLDAPLRRWGERSLAARYARHLLDTRVESFGEEDLRYHVAGRPEAFVERVAAIANASRERGALFVVASQQLQSKSLPRDALRTVGYEDEARRVGTRLASGERLGIEELQFLLHVELTRALRAWVAETGTPFVDFIAALERRGRRDWLRSWVHLDPRANEVLAAGFGEAILARLCAAETP